MFLFADTPRATACGKRGFRIAIHGIAHPQSACGRRYARKGTEKGCVYCVCWGGDVWNLLRLWEKERTWQTRLLKRCYASGATRLGAAGFLLCLVRTFTLRAQDVTLTAIGTLPKQHPEREA